MAITKRTRFEILRRDQHACQYCGQMAPDVVLHIDHVIPVALGGNDKPDNLVTACKDCNAGKTSISPDSPIVEAVAARSAEYVLAQANRGARMAADFEAMNEYEQDFKARWDSWKAGAKTAPMPGDWRRSLKTWWAMKVPYTVLEHGVDVAMGTAKVAHGEKFQYFAGVVWRTIDDYDLRYPSEANAGRVYSRAERDEAEIDGWQMGYEAGEERAQVLAGRGDLLRHLIDGTQPTKDLWPA